MHPLLDPANKSTLTASIDVPPLPPGNCLARPDDLRKWIGSSPVVVQSNGASFGFTAGTLDDASPESRSLPRFIFDTNERFLGMALWIPSLQGWSIGGQIGQLMILHRSLSTLAADMAARPIAGWKLCDGTTSALPNLTANSDFFSGSSPDYTKYTVGYVG